MLWDKGAGRSKDVFHGNMYCTLRLQQDDTVLIINVKSLESLKFGWSGAFFVSGRQVCLLLSVP